MGSFQFDGQFEKGLVSKDAAPRAAALPDASDSDASKIAELERQVATLTNRANDLEDELVEIRVEAATVTIPPRCRLVQDGSGVGLDSWRCLSAGCASSGRTRNGILYEAGTGKQVVTGGLLPMELAFIGPHDGVVGEKCMFDSCHAAPGAPPAPPAPANSELESLRKTVELLEARVRKLEVWGRLR